MFNEPVAIVKNGKAEFFPATIDLPESCEDACENTLLHITRCGRLRIVKDVTP